MVLFLMLFFSWFNCLSMERQETTVSIDRDPYGISSPHVSGSSSTLTDSEEVDLCNRTIDCLYRGNSFRVRDKLRPHLQRMIRDEATINPRGRHEHGVDTLRRLTSGDLDEHSHDFIHDLVSRATLEALDHSEQRIDRRWNKKQVAMINSITGLVCTVVTALVTSAIK